MQENELCFLENAMNSLSQHAVLSKFISTYCIEAFSEELAKRAYCAKRVHPLSMNTHPLAELPVAKRG